MFKRIFAAFLVCALLAVCFAGCGGRTVSYDDDPNQKVELNWYVFIGEQADLERANDYINELLEPLLPNTTVNLVQDPGFTAKWSKWMAAGEPIDIAWTGYMVGMQTEAESKSYLPLDELLTMYGQDILEEANTFNVEYETGKLGGVTYALPNLQPTMKLSPFLEIPVELYEYFDVETFVQECKSSTKLTKGMLDVIDKYFAAAFSSGKTDTDTISNAASIGTVCQYIATRGYDWVGRAFGDCWLVYDAFEENAQIKSFMETEEYKLYCEYAAKWKQDGYIPEDVLSAPATGRTSVLTANGNELPFNTFDETGYVKQVLDANGKVTTYRILTDNLEQKYLGTNTFGSLDTYTCLPTTCRYPGRAMKLLNLLKTEEGNELLNAIAFGIEGRHYTLEESADGDMVAHGVDYVIQPERESLYGIPNWEVGNVYDMYRTPTVADGQKAFCLNYIENIRPTLPKTKYYNFQPSTKDFSAQYKNCVDVIGKYNTYLINGVEGANWTAKYDAMLKELNDYGINTIKQGLEAQAK